MNKRYTISKLILFIQLLFVLINSNAQTGLNFQGVARTNNNVILASQPISLRLSILQGSASGTTEYTETRKVTTNAQGLFSVVIGDTDASSTIGNFSTINWKNTPKFLKIEMDAAAGNNYITMGTTQFQYVAYAQFASSVDADNIAGIVPIAKGGTGATSLASLKAALAIDKTSIGLSNIDNTTDLLKPISTATQTVLDIKANTSDVSNSLANKVDKINGKDLSSNDYTTAEKTKLAAITGSNTGDQDLSSYATNSALALKVNAADLTTSLALKENASNKSSAADLGGLSPSDELFPTQKAVKDYVTANANSGGVADGGITTIKLADGAVTDSKIATGISKSKVGLGNVENTALSTWAGSNNLTTVGTITSGTWSGTAIPLNNGGTGATNAAQARANLGLVIGTDVQAPLVAGTDYQIPLTAGTSYIVPNSSITAKTKIKITYDTKGLITAGSDATTADIAPSTDRNYVTDAQAGVISNTSGINTGDETTSSIKSKLGITTLSGSNTGDQTNIIGNAGTATKLATARKINNVDFDGSGDIIITAIADAGTLSGTTLNSTVTGSSLTTVGIINSGTWSGTAIALSNGGTGATNATAARANLGLVIGANVQAPLVAGTDYQIPLIAGTNYIVPNSSIAGATKTKITYDTKGLITAGADATTADITPSTDRNYVTDVQSGVISNTSGINTGDETTSSIKSKLGITTLSGSNTGDQTNVTGNAGTATKLATARKINNVDFDGSGDITVTADAGTLTGTTLKSTVTSSSLTSVGTLANLTVTNAIAGSITGNAGTATKLATPRNINGVAFDGSGDITITADAGTLTGTTLNSTVTGSSLTSVGTLTSATVNGKVIVGASSAASASAVLEASSTTQGFLPPRMSGAQRDAISSKAAGLVVWCTNCGQNGELQVYNGTAWTNMIGGTASNAILRVGDEYQGGIIAYILVSEDPGYDANVQHGLIATAADISTAAQWGCFGTTISGADGTAIGTGNQNTIDIMAGCATAGIAARLCGDLVQGGYSDWYLPSKDELNKLYLNRTAIGGFAIGFNYWSSTEGNANLVGVSSGAWCQSFYDGYQADGFKNYAFNVRAIRAF